MAPHCKSLHTKHLFASLSDPNLGWECTRLSCSQCLITQEVIKLLELTEVDAWR